MTRPSDRFRAAALASLLLVCLAYANHWHNVFHFDDEHTIVQNPNIRQLSSLPRLLTDATAASIFPTHAVYRPVTYVTLAVDYALAGKLDPRVFHLSTFLGFLAIIMALFVACRRVLDETEAHADNRWWALGAATLFGVHPVGAQTINYIIQRAELWAALGVVGSVAVFAAWPGRRRYGCYLLPGILGVLAKTTASIFPFPILLYTTIVERNAGRRRWLPFVAALVASTGVTTLCAVMTLSTGTFDPGAAPAVQYRWTQPWIVLRYVRNFILPLDLSLDPGWQPLASPLEARALAGYAGVTLLVASSVWLARKRATAPIAFGIAWCLVTLIPVTVFPLAEVTNDHRMFLPFMGLAIAVAGVGRWLSVRAWIPRPALAGVCIAILLVAAAGTWQRNTVWASQEAAWRDAAAKSPENGRALMNYGVALMQRADYANALAQFEQAARFSPDYDFLEVNLGIVKGALGRTAEAEAHFLRAIAITPLTNVGHFYYGRWLAEQQRYAEAVGYLERAVSLHQDDMRARDELMKALTAQREMRGLDALSASVRAAPTAERWLDLSLQLHSAGDFAGSIDAARQALALRPDDAEAFNNIAAAHNALGQWNAGIEAATRALAIRPDFALARSNLAWARAQGRSR